ncbi:hypothetical protein LJE72_24720 [Desulfosporosinus sp. SRJS8]|nr:hypothetical protein [Desulfosporosinus sp. SRJS8]
MNDYYVNRVKEQNEDLKSKKVREDLKISLTDKAYEELKLLAYKAGFQCAEQLLSSFVGDLTGWGGSNGSDERDCADRWFERALVHVNITQILGTFCTIMTIIWKICLSCWKMKIISRMHIKTILMKITTRPTRAEMNALLC